MQVLSYRPLDYVYSTALDRLVMVNPAPNQLHLHDPVGKSDAALTLPYAPNCVALGPDGKFAAVGHDGYVSWVDLSTMAIVRTVALGYDVAKVAVVNGYILAFPRYSNTGSYLKYFPTSSGTVSTSQLNNLYIGTGGGSVVVSPDNTSALFYGVNYARIDVSAAGVITTASTGLSCPNDTLLDATRIFGCANVFTFSGNFATLNYRGKLDTTTQSVTYSPARDELAAVYLSDSYYGWTDNEIRLFSMSTLGLTGKLPLPQFVSGAKSARSKGKYLAYSNDGSKLVAVAQADPAAGFLNDFALVTYDNSSNCPTTLTAPNTVVSASGGRLQVDVATSGCVWQASTAASWISFPRSTRGSNGSTLQIFASPNPGYSSRTASVSVGTQTLTIIQSSRSAPQQTELLPYTVLDAAYSKALDRMIFISSDPDQLHVYDAATKTLTGSVELGGVPTSLSLSPDGLFAAVYLDGRILRIDLQQRTVVNTFLVPEPAGAVALSSTFVYSAASTNYYAWLRATEIATNTQTLGKNSNVNWSNLLLSADAGSVFALGGNAPQRWRLTAGIPAATPVSATGGNSSYYNCSDGWPTADGIRLFTTCGSVFRLSDAVSQDMQFPGQLPGQIGSFVHLPGRGQFFTIGLIDSYYSYNSSAATEIQRYSYQDLVYISKSPLPMITAGGAAVQSQGKYLFASADESNLYAILRGQSSSGNTTVTSFAVYSVPVDGQTNCTYTLTPSKVLLTQSGYSQSVSVATQSACSWTATSNDSWLTASGSGVGPGAFNVSATPNTGNTRRSGSITLTSVTLPVTQLSLADCSFVVPSSLTMLAGDYATTGYVEATAGCAWTANVPNSSGIYGSGSGTGSGSFTVYSSSVPASGASTTATVAGQPVQITVLSATGCKANFTKKDFAAAGQSAGVTLSFTGNCPSTWTSAGASSWLQIYPLSGSTSGTQTVQLTVFPNFSRQWRYGNISLGTAITTTTFSQSASTATDDGRFVGRTYFAALGRSASQLEIDYQTSAALSKGVSRADLMMNFLNSAEFNGGGRFIAGLYVGLLARDAEYGGWAFQRNALLNNQVSQDSLVSNFLNSAEWKLRFGTPSDAEFVRLLYRYILLREASNAEVAFQAGALPAQGRTAMARNFLNSQEFQISTGPRLTAFLIYGALLGRDPRPDEFSAAVTRLTAGTPVKTLVQELLDTAEFAAQVY